MIVQKCDICGAEMRMTTPRYKVVFDGWLYKQEKDICIDCFKRIADEIKQADAPRLEVTKEEFEKIAEKIKSAPLRLERLTDCGWGEVDD